MGDRPDGWVRAEFDRAIIANKKYGSRAPRLAEELVALSTDSRRLLIQGKPGSALGAVAFFHLRFENIHPLHDGNGRVGRTIVAGQLLQSCGVLPARFERILGEHKAMYQAVFKANISPDSCRDVSFPMLVALLSTVTGMPASPPERDTGFSLEPLYPDPGKPPAKQAPAV